MAAGRSAEKEGKMTKDLCDGGGGSRCHSQFPKDVIFD